MFALLNGKKTFLSSPKAILPTCLLLKCRHVMYCLLNLKITHFLYHTKANWIEIDFSSFPSNNSCKKDHHQNQFAIMWFFDAINAWNTLKKANWIFKDYLQYSDQVFFILNIQGTSELEKESGWDIIKQTLQILSCLCSSKE
jgi:hypothetical protein